MSSPRPGAVEAGGGKISVLVPITTAVSKGAREIGVADIVIAPPGVKV